MAKPNNGEGESGTYLLVFNPDVEEEMMAWEMKQQLARNRKLKRALIGFLSAMWKYQEDNDKYVDVDEFISRFINGVSGGLSARAHGIEPISIDDLESGFTGAVNDVQEEQVSENFFGGLGDLLGDGDDDDDLWDD